MSTTSTPPLLSVPLKKTTPIDLVKPLKSLISNLYSTAEPGSRTADFTNAINEFNRLRNNAIGIGSVKSASASGLESLHKYYDQLAALELKIPAHEVNITFKWKDAFDKGSFFGGKVSLAVPSLAYEKNCVLFNIAAISSQLGAGNRIGETDEELKSAAKYFTAAAGIFEHLRMTVNSGILGGQEPTPDLSTESLSILCSLMTAQAQEIYVMKAIGDKLKDGILAKLCGVAEEGYAELMKNIQKENTKGYWDKEWIAMIAGKQACYAGIANYYQANVAGSKSLIGEQIARLQKTLDYVKEGQSRAGIPTLFADFISKASRALTDAKKDNDFIYHERIPEFSSLEPIEKSAGARLGKPTPVPANFGTIKGSAGSLFEDLVPVPVHQATIAADLRKSEMINSRIGKLREGTQFLNGFLNSLNLPAAVEETGAGAGSTIPESLREKSQAVVSAGGISALQNSINELPHLVLRNREILDETTKMIREEEETDQKLRAQFGATKWTRIPSDKLNATFKANAEKYRSILDNALSADQIVQNKLKTHREGIEILSGGEGALIEKLPKKSGVPAPGSGSAELKNRLRGLCSEVENLKTERETIEDEIKNMSFDMKSEFLRALAADGVIDEPVISTTCLSRAFEQIDWKIKKSMDEQERLVREIQGSADQYFGTGGSGGGSNESDRDAIMRQLAEAYDAFMDLQSNLKEGAKFYGDLTQLLLTFQSKISDYCFARKTEKEELLQDVVRDTTSTAPGSGNAPPPRPPQPNVAPVPTGAPAPAANPNPQHGQYQMPMPMPQYGAPAQAQPPYPAYMPPMPVAYNPWATYGPAPGQGPQPPYPVQPMMNYGYPYQNPYNPQGQGQGQYAYPPQQQQQQPPHQ